jgi:pyruvate kinase
VLCLKERIQSGTEDELASLDTGKTTCERLSSLHNLLNYIVMRREDLRPLQARLAHVGLSSLGRSEAHVLNNINRVIDILARAVLHKTCDDEITGKPIDYETGHNVLKKRAVNIFGKKPADRSEYIIVTMPTEVASNFELMKNLIASGMDAARINCAHDNEKIWRSMIDNIRYAAKLYNKDIRILMDLKGKKVRIKSVISCKDNSGKESKKYDRVHHDDYLLLCKKSKSLDEYKEKFDVPVKKVITCTCPDIIDQLNKNETIWIDDGKIGTVIRGIIDDAVLLQVDRIGPKGARIKKGKGLNFPETRMSLPALSQNDLQDLQFACKHADMVGLSYTERPEEVLRLQQQLKLCGAEQLPIIAKIETTYAVRRLPDIIAVLLSNNINFGIMLARGDLAIELGAVRMAEIQEEILWLCEAAHIPVIWATQVFESLTKKGLVSRPEITDAAMSVRAECVMLNKGPYIQHAVIILGDILRRMEAHQSKKIIRFRALHW